jgi:hypothetical protein
MLDAEGLLSYFSILLAIGGLRGSSHRRKGTARHTCIIDMVWLHRLPIPVGRNGVFYLFKLFLPAIAAPIENGEGSAPCGGGCISDGHWDKDQRATHQPDNFKSSNALLVNNLAIADLNYPLWTQ